jgi:hypothetical protein
MSTNTEPDAVERELTQSKVKESFKEKKARVTMEREEKEAEQLKVAQKINDEEYGGTAKALVIRKRVIEQNVISENEKMFNRSMEDRSSSEDEDFDSFSRYSKEAVQKFMGLYDKADPNYKKIRKVRIAQEKKNVADSFSRPLAAMFAVNRSFQERIAPQKRMDSGAEQRPTIDDTLSRPVLQPRATEKRLKPKPPPPRRHKPRDLPPPDLPKNLRWSRPSLDDVSQDTADIPIRKKPSGPKRAKSTAPKKKSI